ncbi:hypothetical protein KAH37_02115 [bacterium]|nr:hypothetical protein [bacterium]
MEKCNHCGTANNNTFICKLCGRSLISRRQVAGSELGHSARFINCVKTSIEKVIQVSPMVATDSSGPIIDWEAIVREKGQIVVKGRRYKDLQLKQQLTLFHFEMALVMLLSVATALFSSAYLSFDSFLRVYVISWLFVSFLLLFIFPFVLATTPVALLFEDAWIMNREERLFSFDTLTVFLLWAGSLLYALPFLLYIVEWLIYRFSKGKTLSLMQTILQITYMKRCD